MSCQKNYNQLKKQNEELLQENAKYKKTVNTGKNSINSFIDKATKALGCDSNCQRQKTIDDLKNKYLAAKTNLITAPSQVESSYKNYLVYLEGEPAYLEYRESELHAKAEQITNTIQKDVTNIINTEKRNVNTYDGLLINLNNIYEYYERYLKENIELENKLKIMTSDIVTNDRKTYYEEQGIESLKKYYIIIFIFYAIVVVSFIVCCFVVPSNLSIKVKIVILVLLIIYPFISSWLLTQIIHLYDKTAELLPKNVYKNI
uniref:Uncharacterized protein n=1 Tax=viral metagenome TaxID=1070528 RepID=A0A6C0IJC9_9ZZZZ